MPKPKPRLRPGRTGACGALLFEVSGEDEAGEHTERLAAVRMEEALAFLRRRDPEFRPTSVKQVGLVVLLSGTPLD